QDAAEQVEMGMCGLQRKILTDAHRNAEHHAAEEDDNAYAHHQRSNHETFLALWVGMQAGRGVISHDHVALCDLKSQRRPAYLLLGQGCRKRFKTFSRVGKVVQEWKITRTFSPISCVTISSGRLRSCCCSHSVNRLPSSRCWFRPGARWLRSARCSGRAA